MLWSQTNIEQLLRNKECVVTWSGGLDTTALITYVIKKYNCEVHPLFVNRGQGNYVKEKESVDYHTIAFEKMFGNKFHKYYEVSSNSPPKEFKRDFAGNDEYYFLRNSDLVNQAVRYALLKQLDTVLIGSLQQDNQFPDNPIGYWGKKTDEVREGTRNYKFWVIPVFLHHQVNFDKAEIIRWCKTNAIDLSKTWSCFEDGIQPCKGCPACKSRIEAFKKAGVVDTAYQ